MRRANYDEQSSDMQAPRKLRLTPDTEWVVEWAEWFGEGEGEVERVTERERETRDK
jgi:hypothetical protein